MRNETLLKIIIGVFVIILIILGTFAYGNFVRSKQTAQTNHNQPSVNKPTETPAPAPAPAATQTPPVHQPTATPAPTSPVVATPHLAARTPATGAAQDGAIGATVIAVGIYILRKSKRPLVAVSKSNRG